MGKCKDCVVGLFGACAGDYCSTERGMLIEEATRLAEAQGHILGAFVKLKDHPVWEAHCARCRQAVAITLDPQPGQPDLYGEAVTERCPA